VRRPLETLPGFAGTPQGSGGDSAGLGGSTYWCYSMAPKGPPIAESTLARTTGSSTGSYNSWFAAPVANARKAQATWSGLSAAGTSPSDCERLTRLATRPRIPLGDHATDRLVERCPVGEGCSPQQPPRCAPHHRLVVRLRMPADGTTSCQASRRSGGTVPSHNRAGLDPRPLHRTQPDLPRPRRPGIRPPRMHTGPLRHHPR